MRRILSIFVALAALVLTLLLPVGQARATPSYCGLVWGSLDKSDPDHSTATLTNVRSGRQDCYDRMVIDLAGPVAGYRVGYVDGVYMDASGEPVPLRGSAFLQVVVFAPAYDGSGNLTYNPANRKELTNVSGYDTFRQLSWAGTFEGQTTIGLGVRARLPFRVFTLDGPGTGNRIVIDVAHRW
ncbi:AMIN-like domain-containing (lipo)protein [Nocardia sp. NPDC055321]